MKLSTIAGLPALAILVTENRHGLAASIFTSETAALEDVVRELKEHHDAPDDLTTSLSAISDFIGNEGITYTFMIEELSLPGYRVVALNTATGEILANRLCHARDQTEAEHFAGLIWSQYGAFQPDRGIKVFLYTITGDEPILTIDDEDEDSPVLTDGLPQGYSVEKTTADDWILLPPSDVTIYSVPGEGIILAAEDAAAAVVEAKGILAGLPHIQTEGERTAYFSERGQYWYVDEVQGGERVTIAKNLTQDQANAVQAGQQPFDGVTGDLS